LSTAKPVNQKAWLLILPVILCVAFSAIVPLMTVVNYSVQDIISPERRVFVGTEWFKAVMRDDDLQGALVRQMGFSLSVLLVEIPLGIALALSMPASDRAPCASRVSCASYARETVCTLAPRPRNPEPVYCAPAVENSACWRE